ncbi:TetR/AcrR family transcriptional regulator [Actinokineospora bangkokensis]|uniref:HTH tetR-type domain-containing protein n=1 Tax=Actinokineospora bangkokensis TaxID=1193682 RepID=A0A1Q9LNW8_9PSEU|nr:TetR/AcrR family transcriptional regulator [Actinokineospora bangkokensis]OLR93732.1 hypothetical protein BJP25_15880 [Actinokineospora bangkokensis]
MAAVDLAQLLAAPVSKLPPGPRRPASRENHRMRLLAAVLGVAADLGYQEVRVADIVERAQVSRRTFYEHFTDKEQCFLAAYEEWAGLLMERTAKPRPRTDNPVDQFLRGLDGYIAAVSASPALTRVFQIDIVQVGYAGVRRRRTAYRQWAEMLAAFARTFVDEAGRPLLRAVSPSLWQVLVAAVNERVLQAVEEVAEVTDVDGLRHDLLVIILDVVAPRRPAGTVASLLERAAALRA